MSQLSCLRRARERRAEMTEEQKEAARERARINYWKNKAKGKKHTIVPLCGMDAIY